MITEIKRTGATKMKTYKCYEMEKITRNTIRIRKIGGEWIDMWGHYPKSFKEAKSVIDGFEKLN